MGSLGTWEREAYGFLTKVFASYGRHHGPQLAAALAYFSLFAVAPLLVVTTSVAGLVYGRDAATGRLLARVSRYVNPAIARVLQSILASAGNRSSSVLALVIGGTFLLLGAVGAFLALQDTLDQVWDVEPRGDLGIRDQLRQRLPAFLLTLCVGLLLVVSFLATTLLTTLARFLHAVPFSWALVQSLDHLAFFAAVTVAFALVYKFLPDVRIGWETVWFGAVVTAFLFVVGQMLFALYLSYVSFSSTFGAAGSVVALLVWLDFSAQVFLVGAEITRLSAERRGMAIEPAENARTVECGRGADARMEPHGQ